MNRLRNIPGGVLLLIDIIIALFAVLFAYALRFNFDIPDKAITSWPQVLPVVFIIRAVSSIAFRTYAGVISYTGLEDAIRLFLATLAGTVTFVIANIVAFQIRGVYLMPSSVIIMEFVLTLLLVVGYRLAFKLLYMELTSSKSKVVKVIVYGAGEAGLITKRTLERDAQTNYKVVAFFDDNKRLKKNRVDGVTVKGSIDSLEGYLEQNEAAILIIAIMGLPSERKQQIIQTCLAHRIKVLTIPPTHSWINGELSSGQIQEVKIEDLLGREVIKLDPKAIKKYLTGKRVLITGAAGSIGSELSRQVITYNPDQLLLIDQAESPLYELEVEFNGFQTQVPWSVAIADITNEQRIRQIFESFKPEVVFHAAAYKHVPLMEGNPTEAVNTNVLGTKLLADLAVEHNVERFVLVSTDKAVNPTNVMGASKRVAEMYVQSLNELQASSGKETYTRFVTTRFGNVLGSNGSVISFFKEQIRTGGPVTVTHPDITRFFMTIPEACELVLEAAAMSDGGEIFVFDMGQPVRIVDLAKDMIRLSGLELGKDINLVYTGLRPGEKLYEEVLNDAETTVPTHHPKIKIAKVRPNDHGSVKEQVATLQAYCDHQQHNELVKAMKAMVPEYISNNSVFEKLDV